MSSGNHHNPAPRTSLSHPPPLHHQQIASLQQQSSAHPHSPKQHPHSHMHPSRIMELFDALKHEVEIVAKESAMFKNYREDLEKKCTQN